ncbi:hypothetical protein H0H81_011316 [Sphagnurus paluster]|uniref:Peroxisomal ATPase PEX6 n=1 Tax=Sphagnurus paluster TaxID=117069 RepID=A0A9P7K2D1_9AGAR|nr:hypothetical protein H0H81_011316 [Sphagnurus paluster]
MSLLLEKKSSVESSFILADPLVTDTVLLGSDAWARLAPPAHSSALPIYIQSLRKARSTQNNRLRGLISWAVRDDSIQHLAIPAKWCKTYPHLFPESHETSVPSLSIITTEPVLLMEVIISALSTLAYQVATSHPRVLEGWFCKKHNVLRNGEIHTFNSDLLPMNSHTFSSSPISLAYRLDMVEPVLQGFARTGTTNFVVILSEEVDCINPPLEDVTDRDCEGIEIDEAFLANAALPSVLGQLNLTSQPTPGQYLLEPPDASFQLTPLVEPVDVANDHCTLYVRTADLSRIGILNGDWSSFLKALKAYFDSTKLLVRQGDLIAIPLDTHDAIDHQETEEEIGTDGDHIKLGAFPSHPNEVVFFCINCYDVVGENNSNTEGTLGARFDKAKSCSPCIVILRRIEALSQTTQGLEPGKEEPAITSVLYECIEEVQKEWKITGYPVVVVGTTNEANNLSPNIISAFKNEITFEAPAESERREIIEGLLLNDILAADVSISNLAIQTAALVASDLVDLVTRARFASMERAIQSSGTHPSHLDHAGIALTASDFEVALGKSRASYSESIGAPKIPNVSWDDVGGLTHVKADILDTIQLPLEHPELFSDGLKKRSGLSIDIISGKIVHGLTGILLYGPPGTGKTLLAKAVATSCSLNFFSIKGPELLNMYIGESEANVRRVFQRARDAKPCVIFFDELDSVAPKRGNQGDSGGVMDRIVSQLLAELDGMSIGKGGADVFVIGATNRPDLLDPALLRPGRFDRMLYLGVSETHEAQANILEALTRKFRLAPELNLRELAEKCPFNYTGADFYALCSDAMLNAMSRKAHEVDEKIGGSTKLDYLKTS